MESLTRWLESAPALWVGLIVTVLCCFTPVLVVLFGVVGLTALTGGIDYALMPLLGFFIAALGLVYARHGDHKIAYAAAGAGLIAFAAFFGRFNPVFAALILCGAIVAVAVEWRRVPTKKG